MQDGNKTDGDKRTRGQKWLPTVRQLVCALSPRCCRFRKWVVAMHNRKNARDDSRYGSHVRKDSLVSRGR